MGGRLPSWEEGELLSLAFLPGKLVNQVEITTGRDLSAVTGKLEVYASGSTYMCFTELSY